MAELEKEIIGSWFEIRSNIENIINLRDFFELSENEIRDTAARLRDSVEGGITEYKKSIIKPAFSLIESLNYDTSSLPLLKETAVNINCLTYVILIQRLISKKSIRLKAPGNDESEVQDKDEQTREYSLAEIGGIVKEVQDLAGKDPSLKSNKNVINIMLQVNKYRNELETMKKIMPNIPPDKRENFRSNYSKTINDIISKLLASYRLLMTEDNLIQEKENRPVHVLESYDLSITAELLKKQAETADRIRTTLDFADRERFKILETIQTLKPFEKILSESVLKEEKHYYNLSLSDTGKREIGRQYCLEIIKILEKQAESADR